MDGCFMNFAYGWAFSRPIRKVYYNITITLLSVAVAFFIGTIELLGLLGTELHLSRGIWGFLAGFNINTAGFVIVGLFVVTWAIALAVWRFGHVEQRWDESAQRHRAARGELAAYSAAEGCPADGRDGVGKLDPVIAFDP
jgi:high-affinity nickel-transport protein